ncbi:MAG TPA: PQQ-dependent dehydrogenase, methanol/ethanol family, partial [Gammaproteobacteria bacterium]|nr:PQQ-dependent dehydrogenase, methanol/ethanol family [Gammaproteobacteria bacterium]
MHQAPTVLLVMATLFIAACSEAPEAPKLAETAKETQASSAIGQIDDARINNADSEPGNWLAYGRTYEEQRFSPLKQINKDTV